MDGKAIPEASGRIALDFQAPTPMERSPVRVPLATGIRVIDGLTTLGRGQRIGLFAGPGLGKSTLLGQIARNAQTDCIVLALVGERGREVAEFIERDLGQTGLGRSVVVCATSDTPAAERAKALPAAMAISEGFRRQGRSVLLLVDSLTRHARALREIALASGEPPGRRGFPASVFDKLAQVVERAGNGRVGSVTAVFTVLTEGDHLEDPVAHEVKGLLDGHVVLSSGLASAGCFPAVDLSASISRIMDQIVDPTHREAARKVRMLWSAYEERRDLIAAGAYEPGSEPTTDLAIARREAIMDFVRQDPGDSIDSGDTVNGLIQLVEEQTD
jgi:ATP synthase in type III secretion protein N